MIGFSRKGRAPQPWDHRLANPYVEGKPATDGREGHLLASVANWQRVCGMLLLIVVGLSVHAYRLGERVQVQTRPYVIEVAESGQVRTVGLLPQQPWQTPTPPTCVFVLKHWLTRVRTVGDSKVLLGQAWEEALSFTAPKLQPWLREHIAERYTHWQQQETVQITITSVLPIAQAQQVYKAAWEEVTYTVSGEVQHRAQWEATLTLQVQPPASIEEARAWRNGLGILISEVHWMALNEKG